MFYGSHYSFHIFFHKYSLIPSLSTFTRLLTRTRSDCPDSRILTDCLKLLMVLECYPKALPVVGQDSSIHCLLRSLFLFPVLSLHAHALSICSWSALAAEEPAPLGILQAERLPSDYSVVGRRRREYHNHHHHHEQQSIFRTMCPYAVIVVLVVVHLNSPTLVLNPCDWWCVTFPQQLLGNFPRMGGSKEN